MQEPRGEEVQLLLITDLDNRWGEWPVTPWPHFIPVKGPPVPTGEEAGWAPVPVLTQRLEEKSSASARDDRTLITWSSNM
jgi:hypothetical protein